MMILQDGNRGDQWREFPLKLMLLRSIGNSTRDQTKKKEETTMSREAGKYQQKQLFFLRHAFLFIENQT